MQSEKSMKPDDFYLRLSELRLKHDVSSRTMSLSIGQNIGYVNNIECGKTFPSFATFFTICEYLNIEPADFFDPCNHNPERINAITGYLGQISEEQLGYMEALIRDLAR